MKLGKILENHVQFIGKDGNVTYDTPEEFQFYLLDLNCDSNIIILEKVRFIKFQFISCDVGNSNYVKRVYVTII